MATKKKSKKSDNNFNFETAIDELEKLVEKMEHGESSLEQSLVDFERGVVLTRQCQESLKSAEQKVQILLEQNGQHILSDFDNE
ncbi:MAG: exodeoxyribonuclease VII small subunit [Thiohalomonadales bacterium]